MTIYDVGDQVRLAAVFTVSGVATDPSTVTAVIKTPDGQRTTLLYLTDVALVRDSAGHFHVDYDVLVPGVHGYRFSSTGTAKGAEDSRFDVRISAVLT